MPWCYCSLLFTPNNLHLTEEVIYVGTYITSSVSLQFRLVHIMSEMINSQMSEKGQFIITTCN